MTKVKEALDSVLHDIQKTAGNRQRDKLEDKQFLRSLGEDDTIPLPVACAFLLVDMALVDGRFDEREYEYIFSRLEGPLGLSKDEAVRLVSEAKTALKTGRVRPRMRNISGRTTLSNIVSKRSRC